jgi:hypothetical protein
LTKAIFELTGIIVSSGDSVGFVVLSDGSDVSWVGIAVCSEVSVGENFIDVLVGMSACVGSIPA